MSRGHLATAVAASGECLAAAASMSSAGAIAAGWRPTSRRYLSRGSNPMRNIAATGSAACAIPRDFRRSADMPPPPVSAPDPPPPPPRAPPRPRGRA